MFMAMDPGGSSHSSLCFCMCLKLSITIIVFKVCPSATVRRHIQLQPILAYHVKWPNFQTICQQPTERLKATQKALSQASCPWSQWERSRIFLGHFLSGTEQACSMAPSRGSLATEQHRGEVSSKRSVTKTTQTLGPLNWGGRYTWQL